jgi:hypothetical protein
VNLATHVLSVWWVRPGRVMLPLVLPVHCMIAKQSTSGLHACEDMWLCAALRAKQLGRVSHQVMMGRLMLPPGCTC